MKISGLRGARPSQVGHFKFTIMMTVVYPRQHCVRDTICGGTLAAEINHP